MARLTTPTLTLVLLIAVLLTNVGGFPTTPQDLVEVDDASEPGSPSTASVHSLSKRHNWVFICFSPGPDGKASSNEDIKMSKRCVTQPYNYYCDGITGVAKNNGPMDKDCSQKCLCKKKLTNYLPMCMLLNSNTVNAALC